MKKWFIGFIGVLIFFSLTFAQNQATVSQTGNDNKATTMQTGSNEAEVTQVGQMQEATVTQTGDNFGGIYQLNNGSNNTATLTQDGSGNQTWLNQGMEKDFWSGYESVEADWNQASVTQTGNSNTASLEQYGGSANQGNQGSLSQDGSNNDAYIYQGWAYSAWGETYETSHLKAYNSTVNVSQVSDGNWVGVWQYGGSQNAVEVSQDGNDNYASVTQGFIYTDLNYSFTTPVYNTQNNQAKITQTGDENHGKVMQLGDNNLFKLSQHNGSRLGYDENAQGLEASRNAYFHQDGNDNQVAGVYKSGTDLSFDGGMDAEQLDGALLDASSEGVTGYFGSFQKGDRNKIGLRQLNDKALIQQIGNDNTTVLWQDGDNEATVLQQGDLNTARVLQQQ